MQAIIPNSPADQAGLQVDDRILKVNDAEISTYGELSESIMDSHGRSLTIDVLRDEMVKTFVITPTSESHPSKPDETIYQLGIEAIPPVVGDVIANSPAMESGLQAHDRILDINGQAIHTWSQMTKIVRAHPEQEIQVTVLRTGEKVPLSITPAAEELVTEEGEKTIIGKIGIRVQGRSLISAPSLLTVPFDGMVATWKWCELTVIGVL